MGRTQTGTRMANMKYLKEKGEQKEVSRDLGGGRSDASDEDVETKSREADETKRTRFSIVQG